MYRQGFTLAEVLISLVIVGVGVGSAYQLYIGIAESLARTEQRVQQMDLLVNAREHAQLHALFPTTPDEQEPVTFTYHDEKFTLTKAVTGAQSMLTTCKVGVYTLTQVDAEVPGSLVCVVNYPQEQEKPAEQKTPPAKKP